MKVQTIYTKGLRWLDICNPGAEEVKWLQDNFRFHPSHFQAVASSQQRPRIEEGRGYDFLVMLFPVYEPRTQEIIQGEVDFFIGADFVITAHYNQIHTLAKLFNQTKNSSENRTAHMQKGAGFLLYVILQTLFRRSYPILDHMSEDISALERGIFHETSIDLLSKISLMKKNIIEFRKMMKTHRSVLEKLPKRTTDYLAFNQSKLYYRDLLEYYENIWDILGALKETNDGLAETNQSLVARRLNQTTKMISIFSVIVLPATLTAFIFAMDVGGVPFRNHPHGFWIVLGLMAAFSTITLAIFKYKKWF